MLDTLDSLSTTFEVLHSITFLDVLTHCRTCVEAMIANEDYNTTAIEDGLNLLKAILISLKKDEDFQFDISDTIDVLTRQSLAEKKEETADKEELKQDSQPAAVSGEESDQTGDKNQTDVQTQDSPVPLSEEDCEILTDFISEAEDNLSTIEINIVDLEQNPEDSEIINNIFRPFHTIKGVAGFLNLTRINRLSHTTETFLDSARSGEFIINDRAADAVLESVDLLKKLLERVSQGLARGLQPRDHDIDIENLMHKLQALQVDMAGSGKEPLGAILVRKGVMDEQAVIDSLKIQQQTPEKRIGEIFIDEHKADSREVASALMDQKARKKAVTTQVKVETGKLDDLVDLAGELVIAQSMLKQKADMVSGLAQSMGHLGQIISNIQNVAMSMRMVPIKSTFMKMIRLVRDLSRKSKKELDLVMSGEDTEIDRNVVDALYEPLVHMIRNSADHGIESRKERADKGKPVKGTISLRACHRGGNIIIEIEDDGKGLDRDVILKKALSTGIVSSGKKLSDSDVYELIMKPGFSTSEKITDVSGRGVGMDVVKKGLEKLQGSLAIDSSPGKGTKFTISLPLTLAIIDGMLVRVGQERYVIPTMVIQRSFKPKKDQCFTVEGKGEMISDRNTLIPLISMEEICSTPCDARNPWEGLVIVVEAKEEQRGIHIDELLGKDEYVIKSLGSSLESVKGFSGGAILADGKVGLILDVHDVFKLASM
ncbi:MAG: chemotaxis protein CheA [Thermodesulfobacteriota bacterium]|nr:chemotaxis protein CheA [Thermodesulfobacteriota bacterium]